MLAVLAIAVLGPLLYLPGLLFSHALLGRSQTPNSLERHFERVVFGALLNGWLAFTLAELGLFSAWLHLLLLALVCALAYTFALRRSPGLPSLRPVRPALSASAARGWLRGNRETAAFLVIGTVFLLLVARPFETIIGARDAGYYSTTGFAIARHGGIVQHDELVAQIGRDERSDDPALREAAAQARANLLGNQSSRRFLIDGLRAAGFFFYRDAMEQGRIYPQGFHLFPAWIGLLTSLLGYMGGLLAPGLMGLMGVWAVGLLGRRLGGPWVGSLAMLFLALNGVQVWFSRYSTTETTAQFLTFAGLYAFAALQQLEPGEPRDARRGVWYGLLAGLAFGQFALVRIEFALVVGPMLAYLLYVWLTRRWTNAHSALLGGLGAMLLHAALHITFIARAYFFDTLYARLQDVSAIVAWLSLPFLNDTLREVYLTVPRSALRNPLRMPIELVLLALLLAGLFLLRRWPTPIALIERGARRAAPWALGLSALGIGLVCAYGYLLRPQILTADVLRAAPGCLLPAQLQAPTGACLALQGYIGAPVPPPAYPNAVAYALDTLPERLRGAAVPERQSEENRLRDTIAIYQGSFVRVGWYLSPLGVALAVAGFALWWWRGMNQASWPFLLIALATSFFFIRQAYGTSEQTYIYIMRRFVPQVYPAFCLAMAYALAALVGRLTTNDQRQGKTFLGRTSAVAAAALALGLVGFSVATNLRLYRHVEYAGAVEQIGAIAERFEPDDVLLFRGGAPSVAQFRDIPENIVTPLIYAFDRSALTIKSQQPDNYAGPLASYIRHLQSQEREVYLLLSASGALSLPGFHAEPAGTVALQLGEFEQLTDQKPTNVQAFTLDYAVYRLVPGPDPSPDAEIAPTDYAAQVLGFYRPEQIDGATVAWTDGEALLRLPWPQTGAPTTVSVQLAPGEERPAQLGPAEVCMSFVPEQSYRVGDPDAMAFSAPQCSTLQPGLASYTLTVAPGQIPPPATGTFLLRITSPAWVPAEADPRSNDRRSVGVLFGGASVGPSGE